MSETYDAALSAFNEGLPAEGTSENQPEPNVQQPEPQTQGGESQDDSLLSSAQVDLTGLSDEQQLWLRAREREMQAQMTKRTQEAVAQRQEAEQALRFIEALNSDPNFANQVLTQIQSNLAAAGYGQSQNEYDVDEYGNEFEPDPYSQEIARLEARQEQMENYFQEQRIAADLEMQLAQISRNHPEWTEDDHQNIIDLGFATGGDLIKAAEQYSAINDAVLTRYLESKASVKTPAPLPSGQGVPAPDNLASATEDQLRAAALEYVRNQLG